MTGKQNSKATLIAMDAPPAKNWFLWYHHGIEIKKISLLTWQLDHASITVQIWTCLHCILILQCIVIHWWCFSFFCAVQYWTLPAFLGGYLFIYGQQENTFSTGGDILFAGCPFRWFACVHRFREAKLVGATRKWGNIKTVRYMLCKVLSRSQFGIFHFSEPEPIFLIFQLKPSS